MFLTNLLRSGWIHALAIGFLAYPLGYVVQKFVAMSNDINILSYICICMLTSSWILLFLSGPGGLAKKSIKLPHTWIYSFLEMFIMCVSIAIMMYISATEAAALARTTAVFAFLLSILFLQQPATKLEYLGFGFLVIGFLYATYLIDLPPQTKITLVIFIVIKNFLQASKKITAELHKTNRKANTFKDELRVAGIIMAVSSILITSVLYSIACCQSFYGIIIHPKLPTLESFLNFKMFLTGCFSGVVLLSVTKYLEFYVSKTLGAKYLMAVASFQIIGLYIFEKLLSYTSWIEMKTLSVGQFTAIGFILLGNLFIALSGFIKDVKFIRIGKKQDTLANMDDKFIDLQRDFDLVKLNLTNLLALYDEDSKKLSKEIEIDRVTLDNIINYDLEDFKLEKKIAKKINEFASRNVALKDKLTKAYNRYYLDSTVNELLKENKEFKLYLLDLNKFKPINDTYGHPAGDAVLVRTVKRLRSIVVFKDSVFRTGGDEFVLIQSENLEKDLKEEISKKVNRPINYENINLEISTSIGLAQSEDHADLKEMLAVADENMFKDKGNRAR